MTTFKSLLFLVIALILFSSTALAQTDARLTIGFSQVGSESSWRRAFTQATLAAAEERDINLLFSNAENQQEVQIEDIRAWISQGVDGIILAPVVETGWDEVLQEAQTAGIPVVIVDRNVTADPSLYVARVSSDFVHEGRLAAAWLVQETSGECNIVELQGTIGSAAARDRKLGFDEVIALFPGMEIIISQTGDFQLEEGKKIMQSILITENPDEICAVWAHNDDMALGAIEAMKEAGIDPGQDILVVSVDAVPNIFKAMMEGDANATVELRSDMAGPAFDALIAYLNGESIPKWIPVAGNLFLPDTAEEEYIKRSAG